MREALKQELYKLLEEKLKKGEPTKTVETPQSTSPSNPVLSTSTQK